MTNSTHYIYGFMAKDDLDNNEEEIHVLFNIWQTHTDQE